MNKRVFTLQPFPHPSRERAIQAVKDAPDGYCVLVSEPTRNLDQNAAMWPILEAFSKQLQWPVNGEMEWLTPEEWKDILTAAFYRERARLAAAFEGSGVVMLGHRTSGFGKHEFSEWLEFLHAAAVSRGVVVYPEERIAA